jgi:acyl-CoA reductase-like NAD-dependent aldehyde dehydrogenase
MNEAQIPGSALLERFELQLGRARSRAEVPWSVRRDRLLRLKTLLLQKGTLLGEALALDFGNRPIQETCLLEIFPAVEGIRHALAKGRRWMRPRRRSTGRWFLPARSELIPQPLGVVGIVAPWNYPILLVAGPLTGAFAAGNTALVKLSEYTPQFGQALARCAAEFFAPEELWVINGDAALGAAFCALPFDHLLFTGSTGVGREVMRSASANLTPVTLELGGKSPAIIGPSADCDRAAARIMAGKLLNAGQTCIAPDYVLVPETLIPRFVEAAQDHVHRTYPGLGRAGAGSPDYTSIISERHMRRLQDLVTEACACGAQLVSLAPGGDDMTRRIFAPVLLTHVPPTAKVMQEEIFGPVLPLIPYRSIDEAIRFVNSRPRPLALYLFESDSETIRTVLARTVSGGVTVNDTLLHIAQDDLPFGGVGPSGMGAYHGSSGFETFSHMKPVFRQSRINAMKLFAPPYGRGFEAMMKLLVGS